MSWYDNDFYQEPSEFEQQMVALKEFMMNAIKDEHNAEIQRLRTENVELQEIKRDFEKIQQDYRMKERELEQKMNQAQSEARRVRLSTLMESFGVVLLQASRDSVLGPKCDKCDEHRRIKYLTPSGKVAYEDCNCKKYSIVYAPEEKICCEFKVDRDGKKMRAWYETIPSKHDDEDYATYRSSTYMDVLYESGMKFESLKSYGTFFKNIEDCQAYCEWLTEQEANKPKES